VEGPRAGAWVHVVAPDGAELDELAADYKLDRDSLEDAVDIYEAPRVEVSHGRVYIYTRYCYPDGKEIATEPLLIIYTDNQVITVVRIHSTILLRLTSDQLEFVTTQHTEFLSALQPQALLLKSLLGGKILKLYEEDRDMIEDIERGASELITLVQGRLRTLVNMRQAYDAIATTNLNNTFKRLTSIAIFLTIPTIIGGLWGMNVPVPLEHTRFAFLEVLGMIGVLTAIVVWFFNRKKWL
jgi:Mg2+ and Co2+ transporter CorA